LRGHLAKANPQWRNYVAGSEALAIFHGPNHYVSPSWYPSKKEHEKVVPTWNYVVVHARGMLCLKSEPEWLLENVRALTEAQERSAETPWYVTDAPKEFIDGLLGAIIGIEFIVTRWEGKWKVGQNRSTQDREGVIAGLERLASRDAQESDAEKMAKLVKASLGSA
jgi:transcriptional regulator